VAAHVHDFFEVALVLSGRGRHVSGSHSAVVGPGDVLLVNPSLPHAFVATDEPLRIRNVIFTEQSLTGALDAPEVASALGLFFTGRLAPLPSAGPDPDPVAVSEAMVAESRLRGPGYRAALRGWLAVLLVSLWRRYLALHAAPPASPSWRALLPVMRRLYAADGDGVRIPELAQLAGWSPDHFTRRFRAATGETPLRFMRGLRVQRAALLLLTTTQTVDEIAAAVGYADARALRRAYRARFGLSPHAFRRLAHPPGD
jgi:AraC-like DNA-binding protein